MSADADASLRQAQDKLGSARAHRKVTKCGVTISSDARNVTHWKSIDEHGNVIDEQTF